MRTAFVCELLSVEVVDLTVYSVVPCGFLNKVPIILDLIVFVVAANGDDGHDGIVVKPAE